jgi:hypothetical protein
MFFELLSRVMNGASNPSRLFVQRFFLISIAAALLTLLFPFTASAHLESPNVFFEGPAGPYPVRVMIQPPNVVPGLARIHIRLRGGQAEKVTVLPVRWDAGTRGAPPPDVAEPVPGETNLFTAQLWLMNSGAYSVFVDVSGPRGKGTAIVPLNSLALRKLEMSSAMKIMFIVLGLFLLTLLVFVVGAAIRESTLPAGESPTRKRRAWAVAGMAIATLLLSTAIVLGNKWWELVDNDFQKRRLYRPQPLECALAGEDLKLRIPEQRNVDHTPLIADHGELMHLFLVRKPEGDAFAHLHPLRDLRNGESAFTTRLADLPSGDYDLYADITHESGLTETLTNVIHFPEPRLKESRPFASTNDTFALQKPASLGSSEWAGGFRVTPNFSSPVKANQEITLSFTVAGPDGKPASLQPYLGMYGHLIVQHRSGTIFTHLHPLGSISMASQRRFAEREQASYLANQSLDLLCSPAERELSFPYAFPKTGTYRLWLQTRIQGEIRTAAFEVVVE